MSQLLGRKLIKLSQQMPCTKADWVRRFDFSIHNRDFSSPRFLLVGKWNLENPSYYSFRESTINLQQIVQQTCVPFVITY